ncbi:hypothetical protein CR513_34541, partial [Mucuna pruriens]
MERETSRNRRWRPIQVKEPELRSLQFWASFLDKTHRQMFEKRYGLLLQLIEVDTQVAALEALFQYYDPPLRCFTFRNFQIAPTLEEYERRFERTANWQTFIDALGLLAFGVLLFPRLEDYIDAAAVEAFLAQKDQGKDPTMAILANTYCTLDYCTEKGAGTLRCCVPLLYLWITAHLFHNKEQAVCPYQDYRGNWIKITPKKQWIRLLDEVSERTI